MKRHSTVHFRKAAVVSLTLCAVLALAACSSSDGKGEASDASPTVMQSRTASATDPKEAAEKEAFAAYRAYWQEMEKLYADPTGKRAHLDQYAASAALKNAQADAKSTHDRGLINTGEVAITDQAVTNVDTSGKIPNATLSSCLDISLWQTLHAKTKKPVTLPDNRLTKYVIVSTVEKYPEGWRVTRDDPHGKSC
ncbi:hypothetical protein [Streptomyces lunaelactis]|uniref:hypothetical protein n=1 Tax=Streptomyces lunaelactis TaxID=1535768 RepID=UPI002815C31A|nr:hypothetical protein [Streptomyces lunaelactis]